MPHGENIRKAPLRVTHATLTPWDDGDYKRLCPVCKEGVLLVNRDPKTFHLINVDRCTYCAQQFIYTDRSIGLEPVTQVPGSVFHTPEPKSQMIGKTAWDRINAPSPLDDEDKP